RFNCNRIPKLFHLSSCVSALIINERVSCDLEEPGPQIRVAGNSAALSWTRRKTSCNKSSAAVDDDGNRAARKRRSSPRNCRHACSTPDELALPGFVCGDITTTLQKTNGRAKGRRHFRAVIFRIRPALEGIGWERRSPRCCD